MQAQLDPSTIRSIPDARISILQASWHREYVDRMVAQCASLLETAGCPTPARHIVPGCLELPLAAQTLLRTERHGAIICFGAILKGETYHFEMIASECFRGLGQVMLSEGVPIIVEVIPAYSLRQIAARGGDDGLKKGIEAALATAEIIDWRRKMGASRRSPSAQPAT